MGLEIIKASHILEMLPCTIDEIVDFRWPEMSLKVI